MQTVSVLLKRFDQMDVVTKISVLRAMMLIDQYGTEFAVRPELRTFIGISTMAYHQKSLMDNDAAQYAQ